MGFGSFSTVFIPGGPYRLSEFEGKIKRMCDMGVEEHKARVALSASNWDLEKAADQLFWYRYIYLLQLFLFKIMI